MLEDILNVTVCPGGRAPCHDSRSILSSLIKISCCFSFHSTTFENRQIVKNNDWVVTSWILIPQRTQDFKASSLIGQVKLKHLT